MKNLAGILCTGEWRGEIEGNDTVKLDNGIISETAEEMVREAAGISVMLTSTTPKKAIDIGGTVEVLEVNTGDRIIRAKYTPKPVRA